MFIRRFLVGLYEIITFDFINSITPAVKVLTTSPTKCFFFFLLFRICNVLFVRTTFVPDEYYQSTEVAHYWIFHYGHLTWEWEPCVALRSIIHPSLFAMIYYILQITKLDSPTAVYYAPKIFQAFVSTISDIGFLKVVQIWYYELYKINRYSLLGHIFASYFLGWFHLYTNHRTFSNSFELFLNIWGVYFLSKNYLPLDKSSGVRRRSSRKIEAQIKNERSTVYQRKKVHYKENENATLSDEELKDSINYMDIDKPIKKDHSVWFSMFRNLLLSLLCSSLCCVLRPNAIIFWIILYFFYLIKEYHHKDALSYWGVILICAIYVFTFLSFELIVESLYYGRFTIPFFNFFYFNIIYDPSKFFGTSHWSYYFLSGLPVVFLTFTPFTYWGFVYSYTYLMKKKGKWLSAITRIDVATYVVSFLEICALTFSTHKEHKMLVGYIPFFAILTGFFLYKYRMRIIQKKNSTFKKGCFFLFLNLSFLLNLFVFLFFGLVHNRAGEQVASFFRNLPLTTNEEDVSIFITMCYDTPLYAQIHRKYKIGFLDCSPMYNKDGTITDNWRKKVHDDNYGTMFYNFFDESLKKHDSIEPYIIPRSSFYWFGSRSFHPPKSYVNSLEKIDFSCLKYRFVYSLNGKLPLYLVVDSSQAKHLKKFIEENHYQIEGHPYFNNFEIKEGELQKNYYIVYKKH